MPSCTVCAEFNLTLLSNVLDLRSELLHKTEKLIVLLGGVAQTSPHQPRKGPHPLKESFSNDGIEVIPKVPKSPRDPSPMIGFANSFMQERVQDIESSHSSHLDLGLRWTADDYKLDIEANKSTVPTIEVFDKTRNRRLSAVSAVSKQSKKSKSERIDQSIPLKSSMDLLTNIFSNRNSRGRRSSIASKRPLSQITTHVVEITAPKSDHEIVGSPPNQKISQFSEKLDNAAVTTTNAHKSDGTRTKGESIAERVLANQSVKSSNTSLESAKSSSMLPSLGRYMFAQNTALQQLLKRDVNATRNQQSLVGMERNLETIDSNSEFSDSAVHRSTPSFADMADKEESNMMHNYAFASFKPKKSSDQLLRHSSDRIEYVPPPNAGFPVKKKSQQIGKSQEFALKPKPGGGVSGTSPIIHGAGLRRKSGLQNAFTAASQEIVHGWSSRASAVHASKRLSKTGTVQSHDDKENREDTVYKNAGGDNGKGWLGSVYLFLFLLPAFDNKGRPLTNDSFDGSDLDGISFEVHGLHPKSYFCTALDFIMSSLFFVCLWIIPFMISYDLSEEVLLGLSLTVTIIFAADMLLSSIIPQSSNKNSMCSFREYEALRPPLHDWIAHHWLRNQLPFDILSTFPFELCLPLSTLHNRALLRLVCLFRLLRFHRLPKMMSRCAIYRKMKVKLETKFGTGITKVIPLGIGIFYFIHFNACTMYFVGSLTGFEGWALIWMEYGKSDVLGFYIWTIFQAVGNIFPMSFKPQTGVEQVVECVFIVVGAILYAMFVGYISSAAVSLNPSGRLYNQKMEELLDYVEWKKLSNVTKDKLISYYETKYRGKYFEEDNLLADMNESLRTEISLHNTRALIEKVPFLRRFEDDGRDEIFFNRIATVLHARYYIAGDFITKQGDSGMDMFFIVSGKLNVFVNNHKVVSLYDGAYIGVNLPEVALISNVLRTATVQAAMPSVLYRLTYSDFHTVINEFPDMKLRIDKLAREGKKMVREAEEGVFSKYK